jgi:anti-anti-sigma factor
MRQNVAMAANATEDTSPVTLRLDGDLDLTNVTSFEGRIERAAERSPAGLIVDLSGLRFIDTAGVAMLFRETARMAERSRPLVYVAAEESTARRVLVIASMPVHESVSDAYHAIGNDLESRLRRDAPSDRAKTGGARSSRRS